MNDAAHLDLALSALALRVRCAVEVMRALRDPDRRDQFLGLVLSGEDAALLCDEIAGRIGANRDDGLDAAVAAAEHEVHRSRTSDPTLTINRLATRFGLQPLEQELLILAAAPGIDPRFGLVYGFLADDMTRRSLTPALAHRILADRDLSLLALRDACAPDAPLRRHALLAPETNTQPLTATPLTCEERIIDLLIGRDRGDPTLTPLISFEHGDDTIAHTYETAHAPLDHCVVLNEAPNGDAVLWTLAVAHRADAAVALLDWSRWQSQPQATLPDTLARALREARLAGALPLLRGWEDAPAAARTALATLASPPLVATGTLQTWADVGLIAIERDADLAPHPARTASWALAISRDGPAPNPKLAAELSGTFTLRFDDIRLLAHQAASTGDDFADALRGGARRRAGAALADLADRIELPHGFESLVLPPAPRAALHDLVARHATSPQVFGNWHLDDAYGSRPGLIALFVGPPGTGKTMAAGAVAHELGIDAYRIDLSGVVSKYIGETERNLERVFQAAERATAVLFFDEADALFGKRSEVQDAHDRYANIEISYLLQRIERFDGVAILATNLRQNLDDAFLRRLDTIVDFPMPAAADRLKLWRKLATSNAPLDDDIDFEQLAQRYELAGGAIRNCAIAAAHAAAHDSTSISMRHLVAAVAREYVKQRQPRRKALFADLHAVTGDDNHDDDDRAAV